MKRLKLPRKKIYHLYIEQGLSMPQIAKILGCSTTGINNAMIRYNIPRRERTYVRPANVGQHLRKFFLSKEELYDLYYNKKTSIWKIGEMYGVCGQTVWNWITKYKIPQPRGIKGGPHFKGHKHSKKTKKKIRDAGLGKKHKKESIEKMRANKLLPNNRERQSKLMRKLLTSGRMSQRPTKPEEKFMEFCKEHKLPFRYVGDGTLWIGYPPRNPDFIHRKKNIIIEVFGKYWHSSLYNNKIKKSRTVEETIKHYKKYGFRCIIIWDDQMKEREILKKLKKVKL